MRSFGMPHRVPGHEIEARLQASPVKTPRALVRAHIGAARTLPDECCFHVIYFNLNIPLFRPARTPEPARVETIRLTSAVKITLETTRASRRLPGFASFRTARSGQRKGNDLCR